MAVPKRQRSQSKQGSHRSQPQHKATMPQLVTLSSGKRVPAHTVTPDNPIKKGIKFLASKRTRKAKVA